MMADGNWDPFDPTWLVHLAEANRPGERQIAQSLAQCRRCCQRSVAYWYFVDASNPNRPGSEWQFDRNVLLEDRELGRLVLDVLKDGRIGGVEFLSRIGEVA